MSDYPKNLPILPIVGPNQYPRSDDINTRNRLIEAVCAELGIDPRTIDDTVVATALTTSFGVSFDQIAHILKTLTGAANWYSAGVPMRRIIGGNGAYTQIATGATVYVGMGRAILSATENLTQTIVAYHMNVVKMCVMCGSTAQPGTGSLVFTLRKNNTDTTLTATMAAGAAAGLVSGTGLVEFYPGDILSVKAKNNAGSNSSEVDCLTLQADQKG